MISLGKKYRKPKPSLSLSSFLTRLIWMCVLPLIIIAVFLAGNHFFTLEARVHQEARDRVHNIATAIDHDLVARITALQVLSTSPLIDDPSRLQAFYREAQGFGERFGGHVVLADLSMQMLFNTRVALGTRLPKLPTPKGHAAAPEVLTTGKPAVGDMFFGPIAKETLVAVVVPVIRKGQTKEILLSIISTAQYQKRLDEMAFPEGWFLTLQDGKNDLIARRAPPVSSKKGDATKDSIRLVSRLAASPWSMVLEIPRNKYLTPIFSSTAALLGAVLAAIIVSVLGGQIASRRLARAMATLTEKRVAESPHLLIAEIEAVRGIMAAASVTRENAEKKLRESEEQLRLSTQLANVAVWEYDFASNSMSRSKNHDQLYGLEWQTKWDITTFLNATHPDDREMSNAIIQKSVAASGPDLYTFDFRVVYPDFSIHWLMVTGQVVERNTEGVGTIVRGCLIDITERKLSENALQEREDLFRHVFESANVGKSITEPTGKISVNQSFAEMLGYSRDELSNKTWQEITPPEEIETVQKRIAPLLNGEQTSARFTKRYVHKNGSHVWADLSVTIRRDANGRPLHFITTVVDITERIQADEKLRLSEERFSSAFHASPVGLTITRIADGKFMDINQSFLKMFEFDQEEVIGKNSVDLKMLNLQERSKLIQLQIESGGLHNAELEAQSKSGRIVNILFSSNPITLEGEAYHVTTMIDITQRKRAEDELQKHRVHLEDLVRDRTNALEENQKALMTVVADLRYKSESLKTANLKLQELDRMKNIFLASMSHELRTPLNSIIGFTGILLMGLTGELTHEQKKQLGMVKNSAHQLLGLINDILDISKVEAGMMEPVPEEFSLDELIREIMASVSVAVQEKKLELTYQGPSDLCLFSDQKRIRQIIINLLSNAIKFTENGSVHLMVQCLKSGQNPVVRISVIDTGIGIRKEDISRLFFPFQQVDAALVKKYEGTGLGLYLSKKLANMLGGDITVNSEYGKGSNFIFELSLQTDKKDTL